MTPVCFPLNDSIVQLRPRTFANDGSTGILGDSIQGLHVMTVARK
jgi:hypothetical protein